MMYSKSQVRTPSGIYKTRYGASVSKGVVSLGTQGGRAANQTALPHQGENPLLTNLRSAPVAEILARKTRNPELVVQTTRRRFLRSAILGVIGFWILGVIGFWGVGIVRGQQGGSPKGKPHGQSSRSPSKPRIVDQGIISHNPKTRAFMPIITPLSNGSWIAAQYTASSLGAPDTEVEIYISRDEGHSWQQQPGLGPETQADSWSYRSSAITEVPDGRLVMMTNRWRFIGDTLFDQGTGASQRSEPLLFWSEDGGITWSRPQVVSVDLPSDRYTCHAMGRLMILAPDRWMYPLQTGMPKGAARREHMAAAVFSSDNGKTWGNFTVVARHPSDCIEYHDQNTTILPDGRLYTTFWTIDAIKQADLVNHWVVSTDLGHSWSKPQSTNLRGQVCCPIALPDGHIAVIYNYRHDPQGIHLAVNRDHSEYDLDHEIVVFDAGGETTTGKAAIDTVLNKNLKVAFGRPNGVRLPNGDLLVSYWCTSNGVTHSRWARIAVD